MNPDDWKPHPTHRQRGNRPGQATTAAAPPATIQPVPRDQWPRLVRALAKLSQLTDQGIGDTVQRITAKAGGEAFKRVYKRIMGADCGCGDRQAKLNTVYPYRASD